MERPVSKNGPQNWAEPLRAQKTWSGVGHISRCLGTHMEAGKGEVQGPKAGASWQNPQKPQRWGSRWGFREA